MTPWQTALSYFSYYKVLFIEMKDSLVILPLQRGDDTPTIHVLQTDSR